MVSLKGNLDLARRALLTSISDVDIRLLRVFVTVTECNGLAASELELNIGKSTISKHLSDLEHRLGLKLCNRGPAGFSLTTEGEKVLELTRELLNRINEFQSRVDDIHLNLTGTIRVGIFDQSTTNPEAQIHKAIRLFDVIAPDVSIHISLDTPSALESNVIDGSLDLAIVPMYRRSSSLKYRKLYTENMALYCGQGHPLFGQEATSNSDEPLDLSKYKYVGYGFNSPNMSAGRKLGLTRAAHVKEEEALALLIQSGRYIGFLADHVGTTFASKGKVWPIRPMETGYSIDFGAITRKRPEPDRKTLSLLECLAKAHSATASQQSTLEGG